jgi:hypothetical protein
MEGPSPVAQIWERPGLSWEIRTMLEPVLRDFEHDPGKNKAKNLEAMLARLNPTNREHIESLSMKKPSAFYEKLLGAITAERDLQTSKGVVKQEVDADFDAIAAGFQETKPSASAAVDDDEMDLDAYATPIAANEFQNASRFVDDLLQRIRVPRQ